MCHPAYSNKVIIHAGPCERTPLIREPYVVLVPGCGWLGGGGESGSILRGIENMAQDSELTLTSPGTGE